MNNRNRFWMKMALICALMTPAVVSAQGPFKGDPNDFRPPPQFQQLRLPVEVKPREPTWIENNIVWILFAIVSVIGGAIAGTAKSQSFRKNTSSVSPVVVEPASPQGSAEPSTRPILPDGPRRSSTPDRDLILTDKLTREELIDRLGTPHTVLEASLGSMMPAILLTIGLVVTCAIFGVILVSQGKQDPSDPKLPGGCLLLALALLGIVLLIWMRRRLSLRLLACPRGFIQIYRGKAVGCGWDQIRTWKALEEWNGSKCTIRRDDGRFFFFTSFRLGGRIRTLIQIIAVHTGSWEGS